MAANKPNDDSFEIRPYARLLTMLGEQLIKNQRIALAEIVKNSYDADASWVTISFEGFGTKYEIGSQSKIIIEDDGLGMTEEVIKKHWLNPATPGKKLIKGINDTTLKGRKIQGEKGIGRFAVLKLGKKVIIVTRPKGSDEEWTIDFDFSKYDDDFLKENGEDTELFLSDIRIKVKPHKAEIIVPEALKFDSKQKRIAQGTRIEISGLKGVWNEGTVEQIYQDLNRLQSTFADGLIEKEDEDLNLNTNNPNRFECHLFLNGHEQNFKDVYVSQLEALLRDSSVFKIENGIYDEIKEEFNFSLNGVPMALPLRELPVSGINLFKKHFGSADELPQTSLTHCGSFSFGFYLFDFNAKQDSLYYLNEDNKKIIKSHRIYLYRDKIRVYPYGEVDDDWLRIDALRGTISAGQFLSNDQVVGFVNITQQGNPELRDKTSREGLIDTGKPYSDFIVLIQIFLTYLRANPYRKYLASIKEKDVLKIYKEERVKKDLEAVKDAVKNDPAASALLQIAEKSYQTERQYLIQRAETTENLAGVGLSVETASHDIQSFMSKAMVLIDTLVKKAQASSGESSQIFMDLTTLRGLLGFIEAQLKDIQTLFTSAKQRRRDIRVMDLLEKVQRIYQRVLDREKIELSIVPTGPPLVAKTTDAVLLQVLLNLFDNAIYWLDTVAINHRKIEIRLDGTSGIMHFSDNGPGIRNEDADFIFEPFFSGKGETGRGLGLYIAKQLLERHEYSIDLADLKANKYLSGANFVVSFMKEK
jgi:signal transduction histidine kinase